MTQNAFGKYVKVALRWWWLWILGLIIPSAISYHMLQDQPELYQARATVMVGSSIIENVRPDIGMLRVSETLAGVYAQLATRPIVTEPVVERLGLQISPAALGAQISTRVRPDVQLLEIMVTDINPRAAAAIANAVADQLVQLSPETSERQMDREFGLAQLQDLRTKMEETERDIEAQQEALSRMTSAAEISEARERVEALNRVRSMYQSTYATLYYSVSREQAPNVLTVLEHASEPTQPLPQRTYMIAVMAGLAGLALCVLAVMMIEYLDDRLMWEGKGQEPVQGLRVFGAIPHVSRRRKGLLMLDHPDSREAEELRAIRANIQLALRNGSSSSKVLMFVSPGPHDGKSFIVANVAVSLALAGLRVNLIDGDLRKGELHAFFNLPRGEGLSDLVVTSDGDLSPFLRETHVPGLWLLSRGSQVSDPGSILASSRFAEMLDKLRKGCDIVLLDAPAVLAVSDAVLMTAVADHVLAIADAQLTSRRDLSRMKTLLAELGEGKLRGIIFNKVKLREHSYYYGYYAANRKV